ncbi:hypothetical protein EV127DRAFT_408005 [Xylaria flabelliformis]|nr:hypothetical protein EV127DRAFT_408005 [Xylaria flabelliformis]
MTVISRANNIRLTRLSQYPAFKLQQDHAMEIRPFSIAGKRRSPLHSSRIITQLTNTYRNTSGSTVGLVAHPSPALPPHTNRTAVLKKRQKRIQVAGSTCFRWTGKPLNAYGPASDTRVKFGNVFIEVLHTYRGLYPSTSISVPVGWKPRLLSYSGLQPPEVFRLELFGMPPRYRNNEGKLLQWPEKADSDHLGTTQLRYKCRYQSNLSPSVSKVTHNWLITQTSRAYVLAKRIMKKESMAKLYSHVEIIDIKNALLPPT